MCEMFNNNDIQQQLNIKNAFDQNNLEPGKVFPILHRCVKVECTYIKVKTNFLIYQDFNVWILSREI